MTTGSKINSFTLDVDQLGWTGQDLQRPESVVAEPDGTLWASDGRGGVMRIDPDGGQALLAGWGGEPNGLAIDPDGNLVTANIALGRVQRMTREGQASTVLEEVDGQRTTSANFVFYDRRGRMWLPPLRTIWRGAGLHPPMGCHQLGLGWSYQPAWGLKARTGARQMCAGW